MSMDEQRKHLYENLQGTKHVETTYGLPQTALGRVKAKEQKNIGDLTTYLVTFATMRGLEFTVHNMFFYNRYEEQDLVMLAYHEKFMTYQGAPDASSMRPSFLGKTSLGYELLSVDGVQHRHF